LDLSVTLEKAHGRGPNRPEEDAMRAVTRLLPVVVAVATMLACATTNGFRSTWTNPAAEPPSFEGKKVAALVLSEEEPLRQAAEDALAGELTLRGAVGVPAYTILPKGLVRDEEKARELLEKARVAGVVALRPRAWDESCTTNPRTYWSSSRYASVWGRGFWGWGRGWGGTADGHLGVDAILVVETLVYTLPPERLVWASQSRTMNPSEVGRSVRGLSRRVGAELEKRGLLGDPVRWSATGF
jgi:hypothetical protein